jgi:hypothetical protein
MALFGALRRRKMFDRSSERFSCHVPGKMELCDSGVVLEGQMINVSMGGAMYRPALAYLMSRKSGEVILRLGDLSISGQIIGTSPFGYGVRFDTALSETLLHRVLAMESLEPTHA